MAHKQSPKPIPFIELNEKRGFVISEQAEQFLQRLEGKKLGVISVVGKYRTGKSYLLNKVLLDLPQNKKGFDVGPTINACTRGIWLWSETIKSTNPDEKDMELIIMDTEGFGGVNEGHNHDTRIFLFSILLSSLFVYNSVGSIDENALQALSLIVNLAKEVQKSEKGFPGGNNHQLDDEAIKQNFPFFLWILRDFSLKLIDDNNNAINSNEYLENALNLVKGNSEAIDGKNKIRKLLKHFFMKRECSTLIRPVEKESHLQNLHELHDDELRVEFLNQADKIRKIILSKTPIKTFNNTKLDGPQILQLAKAYAVSINSGKAPSLDYAWNYMKSFENEKLFIQLLEQFKKENIVIRRRKDIEDIKKRISDIFNERKMGDDEENAEQIQYFDEIIEKELTGMYEKHKKSVKIRILNKVNADFDIIKDDILRSDDLTISMCENLMAREQEKIKEFFKSELDGDEIEKIVDKNLIIKRTEILGVAAKKIHQKKDKIVKDIEIKNLQEINAISQSKNSLQKKLQEREEELAAERNKNFKLNLENEKMLQTIDELNEEIEDLRDSLNSNPGLNSSTGKSAEELDALKLELKEAQSNALKLNSEKTKEIAVLNQRINILESEKEKLNSLLVNHEIYVEEMAIKYNNLEDKYNNPHKASVKTPAFLDDHQTIVDKNTIARLNEKLEANEDLLANYEKIVNELNSEKRAMEKNYDVLKYAIENALTSKDNIINEIGDKLDEIKDQTSTLVQKNDKSINGSRLIQKYSQIIQCAKCNKFYSTVIFVKHINDCLRKGDNNTSAFEDDNGFDDKEGKDFFNVLVEQSVLNEDAKKSLKNNAAKANYVSYLLKVESKRRSWRVSKRFIDFYQLIIDIRDAIPGIKFPSSCFKLLEMVDDVWSLIGGKTLIAEDRRQLLQSVIDELTGVKQIRAHILFRRFIEELSSELLVDNDGRRNNNVAEDKYYLQQLSRESL